MTKRQLAEAIEAHHLYIPRYNGDYIRSKKYYRYDSAKEIKGLIRDYHKAELQDWYNDGYDNGRELSRHEINC